MAESVPRFDLYATLKVTPDAPTEVIVAAHRALVRHAHPDLDGDPEAPEQTKRLNVARDWLTNDELRARYDRSRDCRSDLGFDDRNVRPAPAARRPTDGGWERSSGRAELELFVERCGRLTARDIRRIAAVYRQLGGPGSRWETTADRLVDRCHEVGRGAIVISATDEALSRARLGKRRVGGSLFAILRWSAFAIAVADIAPSDAQFVLTPWRSVTSDESRRSSHPRVWLRRLIPALVTAVAVLLLFQLKIASAAALLVVAVAWLLMARILPPSLRR